MYNSCQEDIDSNLEKVKKLVEYYNKLFQLLNSGQLSYNCLLEKSTIQNLFNLQEEIHLLDPTIIKEEEIKNLRILK